MWSAQDFDAEYAAHQGHVRERKRQRGNSGKSPSAQTQQHNRERLKNGFRWPGSYVNGQPLASFVEHGLRSPDDTMLRLFVARTARAQTGLSGGQGKERLTAGVSKLLLLDEPYISFNRVMRSVIRIDLDTRFGSWDALRTAIETSGLPPPNLAVGYVDDDGSVVNPHAYWLLAQAVCCTEKGRPAPQRFLRSVECAMVQALAPIGADEGGLSNRYTGKNPLSPLWSCQVMSARPFNLSNGEGAQRGLLALSDHVRPIFSGSRQSAPPIDDADVPTMLEQSNGLFEVLKRFSLERVVWFHPRGRGKGEFEDFEQAVVSYARGLPSIRVSEAALEKRARRQAAFAWRVFEGRAARPGRGRCQDECAGKPLREKQRIGALAVAEAKRQRTLDRLVEAHQRLLADGALPAGSIPTNRAWAAAAGVSVRVLQKHREALQVLMGGERRSEDKRGALAPPDNQEFSLSPTSAGQGESLPTEPSKHVAVPQRSAVAPKASPSLSLLTIRSRARRLRPGECFEPSSRPMPTVPPALTGLVLFPGAVIRPETHDGEAASHVTLEMLKRAGFKPAPAGVRTSFQQTELQQARTIATQPAAATQADQSVPVRKPKERAHRDLVPSMLAAQARQQRHPPVSPPRSTSPRGRRLVFAMPPEMTEPGE